MKCCPQYIASRNGDLIEHYDVWNAVGSILVYVSAEDQPEDVMIANIARTCFPELYASRLREVEAEQDTFMAVLPIFYCECWFFCYGGKKSSENYALVRFFVVPGI